MNQLISNTAAIGKVTPFTIAYARYIINQEYTETGEIDPASIRANLQNPFKFYCELEGIDEGDLIEDIDDQGNLTLTLR
jgi:hypothetical protein